ncbi:hypothetical protein [Moorena sp. SIO4G3]|uniref:hypothetical protein n=1 Tax=Moorena sp. SIO4G3 TaxID=2607821 RepID=UPI0025E6285C|nr:hypothetical protein [Moorena sp. SIO4G3]
MERWRDGEMGRWGDGEIFIKRCSAVLGRQRGLGGSPHSRFAVVSPTRALHQDRVIIPT